MKRRLPNPLKVKLHYSHTVDEVARHLGVHKNTVRNWLKDGLPTVDDGRPALIQGHDLRQYLESRRQTRKRPCPPGTLYCLKCRAARKPALAMVDYLPLTATTGTIQGLCAECSTVMCRHIRKADIATKMPNLVIQFPHGESRIRESASTSLNCDSRMEGFAYVKTQCPE